MLCTEIRPGPIQALHPTLWKYHHGYSENLPGSLILGKSGNVFRMTAEQFSLTGVLVKSKILSLLFKSFLNIGANLGMCRRASAKLSSKWRFRKISMNFKAKRSSFSQTFSLFTLDGYGKVVLALGMDNGLQFGTIQRWTVFGNTICSTLLQGTRAELEMSACSRKRLDAITIFFQFSNIGRYTGGGCALVLYFSNNGFASGRYELLDLLSDEA
ncbi:hypothetical protein Tco_0951449 [Tanacetum coccineum]|uniref:Uncharacterized protein n=1 Tax=Tanacetum coccineum TaxID=301880 RepID=A0ABQ5E073_9ASTR